LAVELLRLGVDVIVAIGLAAARAAASATATTPIVVVAGADPARPGAAADFRLPADNVTGLTVPSEAEIASEALRLLTGLASDIDDVVVLSSADNPLARGALARVQGEAARRGVQVRDLEIRTIADAERALPGPRASQRAGLLVLPDALFAIEQRRLVALAAEQRIPPVYTARSFAEAGR